MTLKELLEIISTRDLTEEDLEKINSSRAGIIEALKMALDSFGQTEAILDKLNSGSEEVEEDADLESAITTPAEEFAEDDEDDDEDE